MDATTIGSLLLGVGAIGTALVAYLGKRGENAVTGYSSLTNDLQEERDRLDKKNTELTAKVAELGGQLANVAQLRAADQAEIARLRALVTNSEANRDAN